MSNMIINGMDKNWGRLIIVYGLSEDQIKEVKENAPTKDCELLIASCFTDIIALPQMISILVWNKLTEEDEKLLVEYYSEVAPFSETVIIIGDTSIPEELRKHIFVYSSFELFASKMKYILLDAYRKIKKNENFSATLANALIILREIRKNSFVTTKELAEKLELSDRTIQRYIETLRVAGEFIEYDTSHKGWMLVGGKSVLCGDVFEEGQND